MNEQKNDDYIRMIVRQELSDRRLSLIETILKLIISILAALLIFTIYRTI